MRIEVVYTRNLMSMMSADLRLQLPRYTRNLMSMMSADLRLQLPRLLPRIPIAVYQGGRLAWETYHAEPIMLFLVYSLIFGVGSGLLRPLGAPVGAGTVWQYTTYFSSPGCRSGAEVAVGGRHSDPKDCIAQSCENIAEYNTSYVMQCLATRPTIPPFATYYGFYSYADSCSTLSVWGWTKLGQCQVTSRPYTEYVCQNKTTIAKFTYRNATCPARQAKLDEYIHLDRCYQDGGKYYGTFATC